jgi:hypothetical protein
MAILGATTLTGCNSIPDFIAAGSLVLFEQSTAPTSWTRSTGILGGGTGTLRVVSGSVTTGGTLNFPDAFNNKSVSGSIGGHVLSESQLPSHAHGNVSFGISMQSPQPFGGNVTGRVNSGNAGGAGGSGSHTHPFSASADFNVAYVDLILASKN